MTAGSLAFVLTAAQALGTSIAEPHAAASSPVRHHLVSTSKPAAQRLFDEGLTLVYAFNRDAAIERFRAAGRADPTLAMAWWGVALASGPNINVSMEPDRVRVATAAIASAERLEFTASSSERDYISAIATRYSSDPKADRHALDVAYMKAMAAVAGRHPADLDAATLYAESVLDVTGSDHLYDASGKAAALTPVLVETLESVLRIDPTHIGACHYYIHALDNSGHPERALDCARRLAALPFEPAASHLIHMSSHIFMQTGDFAEIERDGARSVHADEEGAKRSGVAPASLDYYYHNLDFWSGSAILRGRLVEYDRIVHPFVKRSKLLYEAARLHRWNAILEFPNPRTTDRHASAWKLFPWHYARALAYAARGDRTACVRERDAYFALARALPSEDREYTDLDRAVLDANVAESDGNIRRAAAAYARAIAISDAQPPDNWPNWRYPLREWLGAAYLRHGAAGDAEGAFRGDLARDPGNGRSLYGLMLALRAQGRSAEASSVEREYHAVWRLADASLTPADL